MVELSSKLQESTPEQIAHHWKEIKPDLISRYPDFSRGNIDIDESITMELCH